MCMGIIGGVMIYRQYAIQRWTPMRFHGLCRIPYDTDLMDRQAIIAANDFSGEDADQQDTWLKLLVNDLNQFAERMISEAKDFEQSLDSDESNESKDNQLNITDVNKFMQEELELGVSDEENYSKINVPKLVTGKSATFLHDFKAEQTGIIDKEAGRCYVMPLDRETVLPPKDFADLIMKMRSGYYNVQTDVLRKNFRVKLPAVTDLGDISPRISNECNDMNIYELEKIVSGVAKRSIAAVAAPKDAFTVYSGKGFNQYSFLNAKEVDAYEKNSKK